MGKVLHSELSARMGCRLHLSTALTKREIDMFAPNKVNNGCDPRFLEDPQRDANFDEVHYSRVFDFVRSQKAGSLSETVPSV